MLKSLVFAQGFFYFPSKNCRVQPTLACEPLGMG